jgi:hypothetical protein
VSMHMSSVCVAAVMHVGSTNNQITVVFEQFKGSAVSPGIVPAAPCVSVCVAQV